MAPEIYLLLVEILHRRPIFVLAQIFLLLSFPIGIGVKNPKPKAYVPRPGTTKNGVRGSHIRLLILAWGEEPRERLWREDVL